MTYLPIRPLTLTTTLADGDTVPVTQNGLVKASRLDTLRAYLQAGSTGSTGSGSTGSTGATSYAGVGLEPYTLPEGISGPYGGIGDTGTGAGAQAYLYGRSLGDLMGTYTYPNPGGTDGANHTTLTQAITKLRSDVGVKPKSMNAFINNAYADVHNVGNGTFAYGWHNDASAISGPTGYMRPIIGIKLGGQAQGWDNPATYDDIANGVYDADYLNEINTWIGFGYTNLTYRPAYEFNGTFMPDYFGGNATDNARFAAALRHVILLLKNRGAQAGITVKATFNPSTMNNNDTDVMNGYPGDDVIDIIDCDFYNPCYNRTLQNYGADGHPDGTTSPDQATWISKVNNRRTYWNYPGIKGNYPNLGQINDTNPGGWSPLRALAIAKQKGKPIAFSECGCGGVNSDNQFYNNYLTNDPEWVKWFWQTCQSAISQGVPIAHINIWNIYADDGQWWFSSTDYDPQPLVKAAMRKYFGDGTYSGGPAPTPVNGSVGASGPAATGGTGSTGSLGSTGTTGSTSTGNAPSATSSMVLTTTDGTSVTLSLAAEHNWYQNETGLSFNVYFFLDTAANRYTIGSSRDDLVASIAFTDANNVVCSYPHTYNGSASSGATGGTGIATVHVVDTSGNVADLTLNQGYKNYYGSGNDTSLACNIYYFADTGNANKPTVSSSAPGVVSSVVITRNGADIVASADLAGVTTYA